MSEGSLKGASLEMLILAFLNRDEGYPVDIIMNIRDVGGRKSIAKIAVIYTIFNKLKQGGFVVSSRGNFDNRRMLYRITGT